MDRISSAARSDLMARIRSKDTKPELIVRREAHRLGYRFRLHRADLPGKPDLVFPKRRRVIFVHGCFWHSHTGCARAFRPATHREFWRAKLAANRQRDAKNEAELTGLGWRVLVIWECEVARTDLPARLRRFLGRRTASRTKK